MQYLRKFYIVICILLVYDKYMSDTFNYEEFFMGVTEGKPKTYQRTFKDDYRMKRLLEAIPYTDGKILDIGCGGGVVTESLAYFYPKAKAYGCDVSETAIKYANEFGSGKVTYGVIKGKKLPYKDKFFDVCICLDVMEHIPDIDFFLKEVRRILKDNGQFFLLVPCEGQPFTFTWWFRTMNWNDRLTFNTWGHIHPEFTHKYIQELLQHYGFSIDRVTYSEHFLYQTVNLLTYFLPKAIISIFLGNKSKQYLDNGVIRSLSGKKEKKLDAVLLSRKALLHFSTFLRRITYWELELCKYFSPLGWKVQVLAVKKKSS